MKKIAAFIAAIFYGEKIKPALNSVGYRLAQALHAFIDALSVAWRSGNIFRRNIFNQSIDDDNHLGTRLLHTCQAGGEPVNIAFRKRI